MNLNSSDTVIPPTQTTSYITDKVDSGASKHYFCIADAHCLQNIHPMHSPSVYLPNMMETIHTTHTQVHCRMIIYQILLIRSIFFPNYRVHLYYHSGNFEMMIVIFG